MQFSVLYLLAEWIVRILVIPIIAYRYRPPSALAWIAVVSFQPMIGLVMYLIFGENRLPRRRIAEHARRRRALQLDMWPMLQKYCVDPKSGLDGESKHQLSVQLGEMPAVANNDFQLIDDTSEAIDRIIQDIDQARVSVHLLFYIWRDDESVGV